MVYEKFLADAPEVNTIHNYRFPAKSIRLSPVEIRKQVDKHADDDELSLFSLFGSTNLNKKVVIAPSILLGSSGRLIQRRKYVFLGGCALQHHSRKKLSSLNLPSAPHSFSSSLKSSNRSGEKFTSSNDSSKRDEHHDDYCNDDTDFNSSDLVVGLEFSSGVELDDAGTRMYCHFDNNPEDRKDRSVMIALKFNDIRAVIQAHGHLDGCSQFVKVDLGIGDRDGGNAPAAAAREKRFSCVLTSTFPCKPTHPSQCVVSGRLCSISELESALLDYYHSASAATTTDSSFSSSCQQGIGGGKSDKESGKLKFLQGHIFVSICSGDYDLDGMAMRQSARLLATAEDGISAFQRRLLDVEKNDEENKENENGSVIFMVSSNGEKFPFDLANIKLKSSPLAEMIEMYGKSSNSGSPEAKLFLMEELTSEALTALIMYLKDYPLKELGMTTISCHTAISLIEAGRKYKIINLEEYVCQLIIKEKNHLWFDIKALVRLFRLYNKDGLEVYREKIKFKVLQTFSMKRSEDDESGLVEQIFIEEPQIGMELLMGALTICSKYRPKI